MIPRDEWERAQQLLAELRARRAPISDPDSRPGVYGGFLSCARCGAAMQIQIDSKGYGAYVCGNARERHCPTGQVSVRRADPQLDQELEDALGDLATLRALIEESVTQASARARAPAVETTRRLTEIANRRQRVKRAYLAGAFDLRDLQKEIATLEGEQAVLEDLLRRDEAPIELSPDRVAEVVQVFASWRDLQRGEKRSILRAWTMRGLVRRPRRGVLELDRLQIGDFPDELCLYK